MIREQFWRGNARSHPDCRAIDLNENIVRFWHRPRNISECDLIRFAITLEDKCSHVSFCPRGLRRGGDNRRRTGGMPSEGSGGVGRLRRS
jgi:hypothetical protein